MTPPILNVAVVISVKDDLIEWVRIVMAPVDVKPMRASNAEDFLKGKKITAENIEEAAKLASEQANPLDCMLGGSRKFRKSALITLVRQGLEEAVKEALNNNQ
jgi:carbon-monoxide dehydrogenase medium subunit